MSVDLAEVEALGRVEILFELLLLLHDLSLFGLNVNLGHIDAAAHFGQAS